MMTPKIGRLFAPTLLGPSQDAVNTLRLRAQSEVARSRDVSKGNQARDRHTVVRDGVVYVVPKKKR